MIHSYDPAMRTVKSTEERLTAITSRATRAGKLLRTCVAVERSTQNQILLESVDRRAVLQLCLQTTVEGLSVLAISYYTVSLAGYSVYPFASVLGVTACILTDPLLCQFFWQFGGAYAAYTSGCNNQRPLTRGSSASRRPSPK